MTKVPDVMTYASMVSCEIIRIALTNAALNGLQVKATDIMNAYITVPLEERSGQLLALNLVVIQEIKQSLFVRFMD